MQVPIGPPSSEHSKVLDPSLEVNENDGEVLFVELGGFSVIVVCGAVASTMKSRTTMLLLLTPSVATTVTLCAPSLRPVNTNGLPQLTGASPSIWQV